jgi:UDP-xylose/UDP-N-acetylglucosamine transporter B4
MILGIIILKKRYVLREYLAIVLISVGICMCTLASARDIKRANDPVKSVEDEVIVFFWWLVGEL